MLLRPGTPDDAPHVAAIWHAGWCDGHFGVPDELVAAQNARILSGTCCGAVRDTTGAVVDGLVAGFIIVMGDEVEQIYVAAEHRGRGVAHLLLSAAEQRVADDGFRDAWLAVVASNSRARAVYTRAGWTETPVARVQSVVRDGRRKTIFIPGELVGVRWAVAGLQGSLFETAAFGW